MNEYLVIIGNDAFLIKGKVWEINVKEDGRNWLKIYTDDINDVSAFFVSKNQIFIIDTFYLNEYSSKEDRKEDD